MTNESGVELGTLLVIGAGPKAVAVAAKAAALRELGYAAPRVLVVEQHAVGGNWLAGGGWTDGNHRLGTSPEKDVGFPYKSHLVHGLDHAVNEKMISYSWTSYLVDRGTLAEWVDRGKLSPRHREWAKYLQWVSAKVGLEMIPGKVRTVSTYSGQWHLTVVTPDGGAREVRGQELMITGPGATDVSLLSRHAQVLSVAEFWELAGTRSLPVPSRAAVIGGGETAGSVLDELARHDAMSISVISPRATLYTRGESYFENALYSDPGRWLTLTAAERSEVIRRTDRGVFSVRVQQALLEDNRVQHLKGRVSRVQDVDEAIALTLQNEMRSDQTYLFDLVVDATGGYPLWFLELFDQSTADLLELSVGWPVTRERVESSIAHDLSVGGMFPKLYLPNLAAMEQGPGFPNLSCLGLLSDRVVGVVASERLSQPDPMPRGRRRRL